MAIKLHKHTEGLWPEQVAALAGLLGLLDGAATLLREVGRDVDATGIEAHRAQLGRGREWPGDPVVAPWPYEPEEELTPRGMELFREAAKALACDAR